MKNSPTTQATQNLSVSLSNLVEAQKKVETAKKEMAIARVVAFLEFVDAERKSNPKAADLARSSLKRLGIVICRCNKIK